MIKKNDLRESEIQVTYRPNRKNVARQRISSSMDALELFRLVFDPERIEFNETFQVLYLNRRNDVLGIFKHSEGGCCGTVADIKQILAVACKGNASGIAVAHNHPSGNLKPSQADLNLTQKIKSACELLDIVLIDHLILSNDGYYSFADEGVL